MAHDTVFFRVIRNETTVQRLQIEIERDQRHFEIYCDELAESTWCQTSHYSVDLCIE